MISLDKVGRIALVLLPGAALVYFSFNGGGFFPNTPAFVAIILIEALVLRVTIADAPGSGFTPTLTVAAVALAVYTGWTLLSALWSHAPARALVEFDRALLYLLALVLMGSVARRTGELRWILRVLVLGMFLVCATGLVSRVLPNVVHAAPNIASHRLSYPVSYWNALGLMGALGFILSFHLTSTPREPRMVRVLAAAGPPVFAATVYFTFSRGAIVAGVLGLIAYVLVARPRALISGALAAGPTAVVAVVAAYGADALASNHPTGAAAVHQGKHVAAVVAVCVMAALLVRGVLLLLDERLIRFELPARVRTPLQVAVGATALVMVAALIAGGAPGYVSRQYQRFIGGSEPKGNAGDLRQRLTDPSNNGRSDHWKVAFDAFSSSPFHGTGAGTYANRWAKHRKIDTRVTDAHALYFEVAGELGVVGLIAVLAAVLAVLIGLLRRARGRYRSLYGALFAAGLAWAIHAGVDWDWEMPAVTMWFFALGGAALAAAPTERAAAPVSRTLRIALGLGLLATAVTPALLTLSQPPLHTAIDAFRRVDCRTASTEGSDAIRIFAVRPEPYEILAYCDLRRGFPKLAIAAIRRAVDKDPGYWGYHYGLAVALAADGRDPRPQARLAHALNPREQITTALVRRFKGSSRAKWRAQAEPARLAMVRAGLLAAE